MSRESFGKKLRELLEINGLKTAEFIRSMQVKPDTVYAWLNDNKVPRRCNLKKMSEVLSVDYDHLLLYLPVFTTRRKQDERKNS